MYIKQEKITMVQSDADPLILLAQFFEQIFSEQQANYIS